jgi:hypothetical protein
VKGVAFTGGEPFVYYRDLLAILNATQDSGLPFRIVTAAHWAESVEAARQKLLPLQERGLTELSVSTDPSHQAFVPSTFAEHAVEAAQSLGITCELAGVFWDSDTQVKDVVRVAPGVRTTGNLAVPIGRGKGRRVTPEDYRVGEERFLGCGKPQSYDLTVYPDGEVYPCCSGGFNIQARLSFGNLRQEPLRDIVERMHGDAYTRLVMEQGFALLYDLARFKFPSILASLPEWTPCVSPCQLCARIHSNPVLMEALQPVLQYADKIVSAMDELAGTRG